MANIKGGMLHRAFSVFLFNTKGEVLLQKVRMSYAVLRTSSVYVALMKHGIWCLCWFLRDAESIDKDYVP